MDQKRALTRQSTRFTRCSRVSTCYHPFARTHACVPHTLSHLLPVDVINQRIDLSNTQSSQTIPGRGKIEKSGRADLGCPGWVIWFGLVRSNQTDSVVIGLALPDSLKWAGLLGSIRFGLWLGSIQSMGIQCNRVESICGSILVNAILTLQKLIGFDFESGSRNSRYQRVPINKYLFAISTKLTKYKQNLPDNREKNRDRTTRLDDPISAREIYDCLFRLNRSLPIKLHPAFIIVLTFIFSQYLLNLLGLLIKNWIVTINCIEYSQLH